METSKEYRNFADECERLAREIRTEHHRNILNKMAEAWRRLAEEEEERTSQQPS